MVLKSSSSSLFVQKYLGAPIEYLGNFDENCFNLDSIPSPKAGRDPIHCKNGKGEIVVVDTKQSGGPDLISFSVENLLKESVNYLERLRTQHCPFVFHVMHRCNGRAGVASNYLRSESVLGTFITDDQMSNIAQRDADDEMMQNFDMFGVPPRIDTWEILASLKTTTETEDANSIHSFDIEDCGDCGVPSFTGETWVVVCDADGAANPGNVLYSFDYGNTWTAAAQTPSAEVDENLTAVRMFQVGANTVRTLVARGTDAAAPAEVYYSDDYGATAWTAVTVGATNGEYVQGHEGMWVLDENHIWLVTDQGNVYFSSDGGATFAVQSSGLTASGGNALWSVVFINTEIGFAVGDSDTVIYTLDGGSNWAAATATGGGNNLLSLWVFTKNHIIIGDDGGELYVSWDGGTTYTEMTDFTGTGTGSLPSIWFVNDLVGYMVHVDGSGDGRLLRTISSGRQWNRVAGAFGDSGLNAVFANEINKALSCGDDDGTTAIILEAAG